MFDSEYNELNIGDTVRFSYPQQNGYFIGKGVIKVLTDVWSSVECNNKKYVVKTKTLLKVEK